MIAWLANRRYFAYRPTAHDPRVEYVNPAREREERRSALTARG